MEAVTAAKGKRVEKPCSVALQVPGKSRLVADFLLDTKVWDVLRHWDHLDSSLQLTNRFEAPSPGSSQVPWLSLNTCLVHLIAGIKESIGTHHSALVSADFRGNQHIPQRMKVWVFNMTQDTYTCGFLISLIAYLLSWHLSYRLVFVFLTRCPVALCVPPVRTCIIVSS